LPCPSIFEPLAPARGEHAAPHRPRGIQKYVIEDPTPFIVRIGHTGHGDGQGASIHDPPRRDLQGRAPALIAPYMVPRYGEDKKRNGGRPGAAHALRAEPMPTIVPTQNGGQLVAAFLAKHNGGNEATGQRLERSGDTITATDSKALVTWRT
jgi:DNA (cytosine-5)-methyltransferase 1